MLTKIDAEKRLQELYERVNLISDKLKNTTYVSELMDLSSKLNYLINQIHEAEGMLVILKQQ